MHDYFRLLQRYGLLLLLTTLAGVGITAWLVWGVITPIYQASTSLLILEPRSNGLSSLVSRLESQLEMAGPLGSLNLPGMTSSSEEDLISILRSRSLAEKVAAQVPLKQLKNVQKALAEAEPGQEQRLLVEYLQKQLKILPPDGQDGTLRVRVRLPEADLAARTANVYVAELQRFVGSLINREQDRQVAYLDRQTDQMAAQLKLGEEALLRFQQRNRTVALDAETKALIENLADLEADELGAQAALADAQARFRSLDDRAQELAPESTGIRNELERNVAGLSERQASLKRAQARYQQQLASLPRQGLELARLERQVTLSNRLYLLLNQQAQAARLDAAQSLELFRVLDPALPPLRPVRPAKGLWLAISAIISLGLGIAMAALHDALTRRPKETSTDVFSHPSQPDSDHPAAADGL